MDILTNTQTWALILGLVTPLLISVAQNPQWTQGVRAVVAVVAALVVGVVTVLASGQFNPGDWFTTLGIVLAASQTAYGLFYKPTGIAKTVEYKTDYSKAA